jgi:hypothetical protein
LLVSTPTSPGWPDLSSLDLPPTLEALHLWSQVVGKVRLMTAPWLNHSWHVPLYVSVRGLSTGLISAGDRAFTLEFDLLAEALTIRDTRDLRGRVRLRPRSVADFYAATMQVLDRLGLPTRLDAMPCELPDAVPFHSDTVLRPFDPHVARAYWQALVQVHRVFELFRTRFVGKCSPIHLFWGSFDLAVTRFSGRPAPPHPGGAPNMPDAVARDAYSQEVSSAGFWPGGGAVEGPHFYSYAYPTPGRFAESPVQPVAAGFNTSLGEFLLAYDAVRSSADPDAALLAFLQSTYEAAADAAKWNRDALERPAGPVGRPPPGS